MWINYPNRSSTSSKEVKQRKTTPFCATPRRTLHRDGAGLPSAGDVTPSKACNSLHAANAGPTISSATPAPPGLLLHGHTRFWPFLPVPFYRSPLFPAIKPGSLHAIVGERGKQQPTSNTDIEQGKNDTNKKKKEQEQGQKEDKNPQILLTRAFTFTSSLFHLPTSSLTLYMPCLSS